MVCAGILSVPVEQFRAFGDALSMGYEYRVHFTLILRYFSQASKIEAKWARKNERLAMDKAR